MSAVVVEAVLPATEGSGGRENCWIPFWKGEGGVAFSSGDTMTFLWTYAFIRMALDSKANFIISTGLTPGLPFHIRQCIHGRERANLWSGYPRIS